MALHVLSRIAGVQSYHCGHGESKSCIYKKELGLPGKHGDAPYGDLQEEPDGVPKHLKPVQPHQSPPQQVAPRLLSLVLVLQVNNITQLVMHDQSTTCCINKSRARAEMRCGYLGKEENVPVHTWVPRCIACKAQTTISKTIFNFAASHDTAQWQHLDRTLERAVTSEAHLEIFIGFLESPGLEWSAVTLIHKSFCCVLLYLLTSSLPEHRRCPVERDLLPNVGMQFTNWPVKAAGCKPLPASLGRGIGMKRNISHLLLPFGLI